MMKKLEATGLVDASLEEERKVEDAVWKDKDTHYLALGIPFSGMNQLEKLTSGNEFLKAKKEEIIGELTSNHHLYSLFCYRRATLFPINMLDDRRYEIDMTEFEANMKDVLWLNDHLYRTSTMVVDLWHGPENWALNERIILTELQKMLAKSKYLKAIYVDFSFVS